MAGEPDSLTEKRNRAHARLMELSPQYFREHLMIEVEDGLIVPFKARMASFQREDFAAIDPCLKWLAGIEPNRPPIRRFWRQRARGHSKSTDTAVDLTWLLWASRKQIDGLAAAEDKKQAAIVREQMEKLGRLNPWLTDRLDYQRGVIRNRGNGSYLEVISSDVASSWGFSPHFVFCDELTHWSNEEFWHSLFSTFAKRKGSLIVGCNAGTGRDWRWNVREMARTSPLWHFSAPEGCIAPWIDQETLDEQRSGLPRTEFNRLWMNLWQETGGEFVSLVEAMACGTNRDPKLARREKTEQDGWVYVAALDYAEKHDRTVGVVCHAEPDGIIVDMMDVIDTIKNGCSTRVDWCETWMENVQRDFGGQHGQVYFVLDKYQLLGVGQRLQDRGFPIEWFEFASGIGNYELAMILRQLIIHEKIGWYPGCGYVETSWGKDDLEHELASLLIQQYAGGHRWRFNHIQDDSHFDDRAFALGAACHFIVKNSGGYGEWGIIEPERAGVFNLAAAA